jgi:hypothetical protein
MNASGVPDISRGLSDQRAIPPGEPYPGILYAHEPSGIADDKQSRGRLAVSERRNDTSPALQRRVEFGFAKVPEGRLNGCCRTVESPIAKPLFG